MNRTSDLQADRSAPWTSRIWIVLVAVVVAVYARTLSFGLFQDDYLLARPWRVREVLDAFHGPFDPTNYNDPYFRPLASLSFALEWMVWGTRLWGYHLTNLVLHAAVTAGLWHLLRVLGVRWWAALAGALYFAVVPLNATTVVYVAERTDAMVALAILLGLCCLWLYAKTGRYRWIVWLNVAYTLALLSKEVAAALVPFAAVFWLFLRLETVPVNPAAEGTSLLQHWRAEAIMAWRAAFERRARRDWVVVLAPLALTTLVYLLYRGLVMPPGSFAGRFSEGLNPARALLAAIRGAFKGLPWEIVGHTELPLVVAFGLGFLANPRAPAWRLVLFGFGCVVAGVLPLCFNGGVDPRLFYVAEIGMGIAVAGLACVYADVVAAARQPMRAALGAGFGVVTLVAVGFVLSAQIDAQSALAPGSDLHLQKDLKVWLDPSTAKYVPAENLKIIESSLREAGLLDEQGRLTPAAAAVLKR